MRRRQTKPPGIVRRMFGFGRCPSPCRGERRRHVLLAEPVRLDKPQTSPTAARRRLCGWPSTTRRASIRAALLVWEGNRRCDPRSPRALRRRTGRRRRLVRLRAATPGCWSGRRRKRPICPDAQASALGPTGCPLFHQAVIGFLRSPRQVTPGDPNPRAYSASCSGVIFTISAPPPYPRWRRYSPGQKAATPYEIPAPARACVSGIGCDPSVSA